MKWTLLNFLLFLIGISHISLATGANLKKEIQISHVDKIDKQKLVQCKLCQEMFDFNFNYEEILKSNKIRIIEKMFVPLQETKDELKGYFSKDNMEFITKEISMQYFFKGAETQIDELNSLKFKECKAKRSEECDKIKLEVCEKVLSFDEGLCVNMKNYFKSIIMKNSKKKAENEEDLIKPPVNKINENILNFQKYHFKQKDNFINNDKDPEVIKQFGDISLLELTPEYIKKNFDSAPKSHWRPPKPVLLANFQGNIGDQLKDISALAR